MGYETRYKLEFNGGRYIKDCVTEELEKNKEDYIAECYFGGIHCKWYEHEEDMREFSKKFPTVVFTLSGVGEEFPDFFEKHFLAGKMHRCDGEVVYPAFDREKLK